MTDEEIAQLLADLERLLSELGLDFIVAQERVLGAEGVSHEFTGGRGSDDFGGRYLDKILSPSATAPRVRGMDWQAPAGASTKARFKKGDVAVTPLDDRDRLAILLDLIEISTAGTLAMERDVQEQLEEHRRLALESTDAEDQSPADSAQWARTWDGTLAFEYPPEAELRGATGPGWKLPDRDGWQVSATRARAVTVLLDQLRQRAGLSRSPWLAPYYKPSDAADVWNVSERGA